MVLSRRQLLKTAAVGAAGAALPLTLFRPANAPAALQGFSTPLPLLPKARPVGTNAYRITARPGVQQFHPTLGSTSMWGYDDGSGRGVRTPGYVIEARKGTATTVSYVNGLPAQHMFASEVPDYMYSGAPVRMNTHLHGGYVAGANDGNPYAYPAEYRPGQTQTVVYPNQQESTLLWYHDHADQITRTNVYAGLVGLYIIRDAQDTGAEPNPIGLPGGAYEVPLVLSDKLFDTSGQLFYSDTSTWIPEFYGDTPVVNGAARPYMQVEPRLYRFRVLNASNARFWNLRLVGGAPAWQIGSDGGLFDAPVRLPSLLMLPAERADILVDFSRFAGQSLTLVNDPLPAAVSSPAPDLPEVMQFRVGTRVTSRGPASPPTRLPGTMPALGAPSLARNITLEEVENAVTGEPEYGSMNGRKYDDARGVQEQPKLGSTEDWRLINLTGDTHPIHLHLIQFQVMDRTPFDAVGYQSALDAARGADPNAANPDPAQFATGPRAAPDVNERGWKDTVRSNPGEITRLRAKWTLPTGLSAPQNYVYHCHILEHEDNSMMRPLRLVR
ncbi:MAG: spore coat protein manganese oxidase [Solirubrobacteraceae bacterium]|nr:spore coat protein manganese oxidase [Solirubrobacteraceae bacterium]